MDTLAHVVVQAHHSAQGAFPQRLGAAALFGVDDGGDGHQAGVCRSIPDRIAGRDRCFVGVEHAPDVRQVLQGAGGGASGAADVGDVLVQRQAVSVDLLGQRHGGRLQHLTLEVVDVGRTLDSGDLHVNGGDLVQGHGDGGLHDVLGGGADTLVKLLCLQQDGLAHLDGVAQVAGEIVGKVLVDQVGEYQVFDQPGQRCSGDLLDGNKAICHSVSSPYFFS